MEKAENEFKRKNWYYSEYDEAWYENLDDITRINIWNDSEGVYEEKSIGIDTLDGLIENEDVWEFGEDVFDTVNPSTNLPYGYKLKKEMNHEYTIIEEAVQYLQPQRKGTEDGEVPLFLYKTTPRTHINIKG